MEKLKSYPPIIKPTKKKSDGFESKIRDLVFDRSIYRYIAVGEKFFGALIVEFGDMLKPRGKSDKARINLMWKHGAS